MVSRSQLSSQGAYTFLSNCELSLRMRYFWPPMRELKTLVLLKGEQTGIFFQSRELPAVWFFLEYLSRSLDLDPNETIWFCVPLSLKEKSWFNMYVQGRVYNIRKMTQSAFSLDMNVVFNLHFILKFNIQKFWKGTQRKFLLSFLVFSHLFSLRTTNFSRGVCDSRSILCIYNRTCKNTLLLVQMVDCYRFFCTLVFPFNIPWRLF